jgi:hypothetical protein
MYLGESSAVWEIFQSRLSAVRISCFRIFISAADGKQFKNMCVFAHQPSQHEIKHKRPSGECVARTSECGQPAMLMKLECVQRSKGERERMKIIHFPQFDD